MSATDFDLWDQDFPVQVEECDYPECSQSAAPKDEPTFEMPGVDFDGEDAWFEMQRWSCLGGHHYIRMLGRVDRG